jgi:general secretion pathway protein L
MGELAGLLPRRLRERMVVEFDAAVSPAQLAAAVTKACAGRAREVAVRVPAQHTLRRRLALPLAAEKNLRAVLGFEMDRYTPFKADLVYYDVAVVGRDARSVQIELTVVARKDVDPLLDALRRCGLEASALEILGGTGGNLLPAGRHGNGHRRLGWLDGVLAGCAAVLLLAALAVPLAHKSHALAQLEQELQEARKEALAAEQARKALDRLVREESALVQRRGQRLAAIEVLQALTRLLPDSTWLSHLELSGTRVKLRGESSNASELVTTLENSGVFKGAAFDGSVTREPKSERERFAISAIAQAVEKR